MVYEFRLPDIGEGVAEGEVVKWFVVEGDMVKEDAPLVSVLTDKANVEIPSPKAGRVLRIHAQPGEKVKVGGLLVTIEDVGGGAAAAPLGPGAARPAPEAPATPAPAPAPSPPAATPSVAEVGRTLATPYLRKLAAERGIDLQKVRGSGPGGRIVEADLALTAAPTAPTPPAPPVERSAPGTPTRRPAGPTSSDAIGEVERIPIRGIRRVISDRMTESNQRVARFTYVEEVEVTELMRLRDRMARHVEQHGAKLSYLPFIVKAVIEGLRGCPWMNARMDDAANELVVFKSYHIGIATAAPEGLIVPVLHHAETKSLTRIAQEIQTLAERAREGKLTLPELTGGTFTITSLGALGGVLATPILNYPEVAIMGVHKIQKRPVYLPDGTIGPGQLMNLSVSLDHRVIDGIVGAQFLSIVKSQLEEPHQLFAHVV
jgi:pyruvate dehydrogenase E2 component (dihydrolipoamide acetyltransferase)